jgi:hypothetical protein
VQAQQTGGLPPVRWDDYLLCFASGFFLANTVPHFVHGISGDRFPTPFARPPGKGLSSPTINVLWALANLILWWVCFRAGGVSFGNKPSVALAFAGIAAAGLILSVRFAKKMRE